MAKRKNCFLRCIFFSFLFHSLHVCFFYFLNRSMYVFGGFQGVLLNDVLSFTPGESVINSININIYNGYEVKLTINE